MQLDENTLEMQLGQSDHGLSARRLWEYTELGQVNVFGQAISARPELNDAATFIDIVRFEGDCWRRFKIEPPCRLNFEPGLMANL